MYIFLLYYVQRTKGTERRFADPFPLDVVDIKADGRGCVALEFLLRVKV